MIRFSPEKDLFLDLLASVLTGTPPALPSDRLEKLDEDHFFQFCQFQYLAGMICDGIERFHVPLSEPTRQKFLREKKRNIAQDLLRESEMEKVFQEWEENEIPFLPLKGYRIRSLYPSPDERTMLDVDVLVPNDQIPKAGEILTRHGFTAGKEWRNDIHFTKPPKLILELHFRLYDEKNDSWFRTAPFSFLEGPELWSRLTPAPGKTFRQEMTPEDFFLYFFLHLAHHFTMFGIGVRFLVDYYLLVTKTGIRITDAPIRPVLEEAGLATLATKIERVTKVWFEGKEPDEDSHALEESLLSGTLLGLRKNTVLNQFRIRTEDGENQGGIFRYLRRSLFPPYSLMVKFYPVLRSFPILTPLFWVPLNLRRLLLFPKYLRKIRFLAKDATRQSKAMEEFYRDLGLSHQKRDR